MQRLKFTSTSALMSTASQLELKRPKHTAYRAYIAFDYAILRTHGSSHKYLRKKFGNILILITLFFFGNDYFLTIFFLAF